MGGIQLLPTVTVSGEREEDEQELLSLLAHKHHYIEYESESDSGSEMDNVVTACLHISLYSPVEVRAFMETSTAARDEFLSPTISPLSPLSLLSHKLTQRLATQRGRLELPDLTNLSPCYRAVHGSQTSTIQAASSARESEVAV